MKINTELLHEVEKQLAELHSMVSSREYVKEVIARKIGGIENGLRKVNKTTREELEAYQQQNIAWQQELKKRYEAWQNPVDTLLAYSREFVTAAETMLASENGTETVDPMAIAQPDLDPDKINAALNDLGVTMTQINGLLAQNLRIKLAWRRRWLLRLSWVFFRFNNVVAKIISITAIASVAFVTDLLLKDHLETWPKYFVTVGIALASGFSFDLSVEYLATRYFWHNARRWTVALAVQLKLVLDHIIAVQSLEQKQSDNN